MLRFDEGEEIFFDTAESFSSEESLVVSEESRHGIWLELKSVKERREKFLRKMGFIDIDSLPLSASETVEMDRVVESSGAVTSSCPSYVVENLACDIRESNGEANCMIESEHELLDNLSAEPDKELVEQTCSSLDHGSRKAQVKSEDSSRVMDVNKKKAGKWWKTFSPKMKKNKIIDVSGVAKVSDKDGELTRMKVQQNKKKHMEFTAVYAGQEIRAHRGLIWTMKFSPDGQYLASGGDDGVVRIWRVSSVDSSSKTTGGNFQSQKIEESSFKTRSRHASVVLPEKVFHIFESPLQEFNGHSSDILDLAWSTSNHLLSASKDRTVRLWQVGSNECLSVYVHSNYVTCIQFNPVNENYFITGSVDGKLRIWGVPEKRVVNWADARDIITAVCYQPNGKGFVTGSIFGTCRFFELADGEIMPNAEIQISGRRKSSGNKITGIQFVANDSQRVMVTSEDSKIRILDGLDIVHKYKGLTKSGSQMSASFTSTGQHIISVGEDSRIYVWNYDHPPFQSSESKRSARSCEYFFFEGVSVALPWSSMGTNNNGSWLETQDPKDSYSLVRDAERFSLASWFSVDVSSRGSATWPEEKLPLCEAPSNEEDNRHDHEHGNHLQDLKHHQHNSPHCRRNYSAAWGVVIVTAGWDGMIRTFHNYGLPTKT